MQSAVSGQFGFAAGTLTARARDGGLLGGRRGEKLRVELFAGRSSDSETVRKLDLHAAAGALLLKKPLV